MQITYSLEPGRGGIFTVSHGKKKHYVYVVTAGLCGPIDEMLEHLAKRLSQASFALTGERTFTVDDFALDDNVKSIASGMPGIIVGLDRSQQTIMVRTPSGDLCCAPSEWAWVDPAQMAPS